MFYYCNVYTVCGLIGNAKGSNACDLIMSEPTQNYLNTYKTKYS